MKDPSPVKEPTQRGGFDPQDASGMSSAQRFKPSTRSKRAQRKRAVPEALLSQPLEERQSSQQAPDNSQGEMNEGEQHSSE